MGLIDYDNDGWNDIFIVNGHVFPVADHVGWGSTYAQRPLLFRNTHEGKYDYIAPVKDTGLAVVLCARGAAFGDLFNDGKIDVVISPVDGPPVLLRNVNSDHHHWVELNLTGGKGSPARRCRHKGFSQGQRDAHAPGCSQFRQLHFLQRQAPALWSWHFH